MEKYVSAREKKKRRGEKKISIMIKEI